MKIITEISKALQDVLSIKADKISKKTNFVKRESKMTGSLFAQTLVFGWLSDPNSSFEDLSQAAKTLGLDISAQGIEQRLNEGAANFLMNLLNFASTKLISTDKVCVSLLNKFKSVYILDSSILTLDESLKDIWKGNGGKGTSAALKIEVRLDLVNGELHGPLLESGRGGDRGTLIDKDIPEPGGLRIADLGYFSIKKLKELDSAGSYFLSRLSLQTHIYDSDGIKIDLVKYLSNKKILDTGVLLSAQKMPVRIIAIRIPSDELKKRKAKVKRKIEKQGGVFEDSINEQLIEWNIYVTNIPSTMLNFKECLVLLKARWQIEMLFKLWKSYGGIETYRSKKKYSVLCEVYAKLLAMLIQHWLFLITFWSNPARSMVKASKTIKKLALTLAFTFSNGHQQVEKTLNVIGNNLKRGCCINKKKKKPATHQLLNDYSCLFYSLG